MLCLLAAGTANAAKISFSDKGWIDVGGFIQAQYRMEQDAAADGHDLSNDFLLRRARILSVRSVQRQHRIHHQTPTSPTGRPSSAARRVAANATAWNNTFYLLDALATYKFGKELMLDAGLMLLPFSHNSMTSGSKYATVNNFPSYFAANSQRGTRDVGIEIRGLLLDDRIYYRLGVFNGVQTSPPGTLAAAIINPGDAPRFAGMLRFNIAGKEDGYAFCQVCFATTPIISIGVSIGLPGQRHPAGGADRSDHRADRPRPAEVLGGQRRRLRRHPLQRRTWS